ncbi:MAG: hypothetical protein Barrevirus18_8 [Barrevirus sp.]|uniref:Uncharacterized protein n=1 Tax=Barrevirus sp. TaxID=2487763 RepID=A0A3G4ZSA7_9VIRU|nr:MAG: hypothetical protein Barrevirus18_8 [Barrevirus sp.]
MVLTNRYTVGDLLDSLQALNKSLEDKDLTDIKLFIGDAMSLKDEVDRYQNSVRQFYTEKDLQIIEEKTDKLIKLNKKIQEVGAVIYLYVKLHHNGIVDNKIIISLADVYQFVLKFTVQRRAR